MADRYENQAAKVVDAFKNRLTPNALAHINDADFEALAFLIQEAIGMENSLTAVKLEQLVKDLRNDHNKVELEL